MYTIYLIQQRVSLNIRFTAVLLKLFLRLRCNLKAYDVVRIRIVGVIFFRCSPSLAFGLFLDFAVKDPLMLTNFLYIRLNMNSNLTADP